MADEDLNVKVSADTGDATQGLKDVAQNVKDLKDQVASISEGVTSFKDAFIKAFSVEKVFQFVEAMTGAATAMEKFTTALGTTATVVSTFGLAASSVGVSVGGIVEAMTRVEQTVVRAAAGIDRSKDALSDLGLKAKDFTGLNFEQKFDLIAQKLAMMRDGTEKTAIAQQLLGSASTALLPLLNEGAGGLDKFREMVKRTAVEGPPEFAAEMSRLDVALIEVQASLIGAGKSVITALSPALTGATQAVSALIERFTESVNTGGTMKVVMDGLAIAVKSLATALVVAVMAVDLLWTGFKTFITSVGNGLELLVTAITRAFSGDFEGARAALRSIGDATVQTFQAAQKDILKSSQAAVDQLNIIWGKHAEATEKTAQTTDANRRRRNQDAITAAMSMYENDIKLAQQALQRKSAILDIEVSLGRLSQNQKFAALQEFTEQSYQEQLKTLQQELTIGGLKAAQIQGINNRILQLQSQHETQMVNLDRQSLQAQIANWRQYTDAVAGAFNSQMRGILTGQTSFAQAAKNILLDLSLKTIELLVTKPVSEYIAGQLALLTFSQSGAAARAAAETAAGAAALPAKIATFTSDLTARAALTFAGVFANLSPLLGPAAAGPAAASEASVMAQLAAVPKFDVGAWSVPATGLAVIHQGETILPAGAPAEAYRSAASDGGGSRGVGGSLAIHIHAMDAGSVRSWLQNGGAKQLAVAVSAYQDKNPSARPKA